MFSFNRSEQIVLILLSGAWLVGAVVTLLDHYDSERIPDFDVHKGAVEMPSQVSDSSTSAARDTLGVERARIDLNKAPTQELERLPKIGPQTARRIVEYRAAHGPFRRLEDLTAVRGIGPKTLEDLRPLTTIAGPRTGRRASILSTAPSGWSAWRILRPEPVYATSRSFTCPSRFPQPHSAGGTIGSTSHAASSRRSQPLIGIWGIRSHRSAAGSTRYRKSPSRWPATRIEGLKSTGRCPKP